MPILVFWTASLGAKMKFDQELIAEALNESWGWVMPQITTVLAVNSMANCLVQDVNGHYWRICPEELSANLIARNEAEVQTVFESPEQKEDWQLLGLINPAEEQLGSLKEGECYQMVTPGVLGGKYSVSNLKITPIYQYLSMCGEMAYQIKDLKDGEKVELCVK